ASGGPDRFSYREVRADVDDSAVGTVTVNVIEVNDLTVTSPTVSTNEDMPLTGNVLAGAHDSESSAISATPADHDTAHGHVTILADRKSVVKRKSGYDGPDRIT